MIYSFLNFLANVLKQILYIHIFFNKIEKT